MYQQLDVLTTSVIDASSYPTIIDAILHEAAWTNDVSNLRLVCKEWKTRVDRYLARHIDLRSYFIQISGVRPYFRNLLDKGDVGLTVRSCLRPALHYGMSNRPLYHSIKVNGYPQDVLPTHLVKTVEILDYMLNGDHIHPRMGLEIAETFPILHTIRLPLSFENIRFMKHVQRIVFQLSPAWSPPDSKESMSCTKDGCTRTHPARKIVINVLGPDQLRFPAQQSLVGLHPSIFGNELREFVLIFHHWEEIPLQRGKEGNDLHISTLSMAAAALAAGARLTIVNAQRRDLHTEERVFELREEGDPEEELEYLIRSRLKGFGVRMFSGKIRFLSTKQYVAEIGVKEFEIESGVDLNAPSPRLRAHMVFP